ncbi:MAG: NUDIX domain-containing protein [Calditrichaceae bacterium]|nr:NUDIX domain-containing protein [Calditrichia bacterium]NUQ43037.1 NUDIX domain-containing protein [Calditrichaceae bacterium]
MSEPVQLTHVVAVNAYVYRNGRFLLLKRNTEPKIWGPPGGRLHRNEDPLAGLCREVKEETGLEVEVLAPANTWFGQWKNEYFLLAIDYLVRICGGTVRLSGEHSDFAWVTLDELQEGEPVRLQPGVGFRLEDFRNAQRLYDSCIKFAHFSSGNDAL